MAKLFLDVKALAATKVSDDFQNRLWDAKSVPEVMNILGHFDKVVWLKGDKTEEGSYVTENIIGRFISKGFRVEAVISLEVHKGKGKDRQGGSKLKFLLKSERRDSDRYKGANYRKKTNGGWKRDFFLVRAGDKEWTEAVAFFRKCYE